MNSIDLSQFTSLFEIGFALHFAVALLDRIHAKQLPKRINRVIARANSLEKLQNEIRERTKIKEETGLPFDIQFEFKTVNDAVWTKYNDYVLDRIYALAQDIKNQTVVLQRILGIITFLSVVVLFYSVALLFCIGLGLDFVIGLDPKVASALVLLQLLPLPIAAGVFFLVARWMSREADRKIRGIEELQIILNDDAQNNQAYATVRQVFLRNIEYRVSSLED